MTYATHERFPGVAKAVLPVLSIAVLIALAGGPAGARDLPCGLKEAETVTVVSAIDGDTVETETGTIRLASIEAPKGFGFGDETDTSSATRTLDRLASGRSFIVAPVSPEPDRYGRVHAHLFSKTGQWLQDRLLRAGAARVRAAPGEDACLRPLLQAEADARTGEIGLWALPRHRPKSGVDPSLSAQTGLYELVEGRVRSVGRGRYMVFLDFGTNFRRDFTVMVPIAAETHFAEEGVSLDSLAGKLIRVRGVIEASGGPAIRVTDPAIIEVLDEE